MAMALRELAFDVPKGVIRESCSFVVGGSKVVADLYKPSEATKLPGVVFGGPLSSVKEQSTGAYGSALAAKGYACLSLDHRGFGESEGSPRQVEDFRLKIQDLDAAVDYLASRSEVDATKMATVGVCLGAAYAVAVANQNDKVKALGVVVGLFPGGGNQEELKQGKAAREHYEKTGELQIIPAASITEDAAMPMQIAVDYYGDTKRALVKNYKNEIALMYREPWNLFNAPALASNFHKPITMIHGKKSFAMQSGTTFFDAVATPPDQKSLNWINDLPHTDFYDNPNAITNIADILDNHFSTYL